MKQITLAILLAATAFTACKKEKLNVYPTQQPAPATQAHSIKQPLPQHEGAGYTTTPDKYAAIYGRWAYAHDTARWFVIEQADDNSAVLYFPYGINTPTPAPICMVYQVQLSGDTLDLKIPNIYPCARFTNNLANGYMVEYEKGPQQGEYLPIIKL